MTAGFNPLFQWINSNDSIIINATESMIPSSHNSIISLNTQLCIFMIANGAFGIAHSIVWSIGVPMLQLISHRLRTSTPLGIE